MYPRQIVSRAEPPYKRFYIVNRPRHHEAFVTDSAMKSHSITAPQTTEIALVQGLQSMGIDLQEFNFYNCHGDLNMAVSNWEWKHLPPNERKYREENHADKKLGL